MSTEIETDGDRSGLLRVVLYALTFAVGYALGSRRAESSGWDDAADEPTRIAIEDGDGEEADE